VSLYVPDLHSPEAEKRMSPGPRIWLTPLHLAEWEHAVAQHVFQRKMSAAEAQAVRRRMEQDRKSGVWVEVEMPQLAWQTCAQLAHRHGARLGTRTLDTLHVATALELKAERFWTFDERQVKLARSVHLKTS
jgi:predicted nucleic acid-binding protein